MRIGRTTRDRNLFVIGLFAMMAIVTLSADARPQRIKLGTAAPKGSSFDKILRSMAQKVEGGAPDSVKFQIFTDGQKGDEQQMVSHMRTGGLDAALLTVDGLAQIDNSVKALQSMPLMFRTLDEVDLVGAKLQPKLERKLQEKGFIVLFWADAGWLRFFSDRKAITPEEMGRLNLWTAAGDTTAFDLYKEAGFKPIPLPITDILPGLNTGLINAAPMPPLIALTMQADTKAKHMLDLDWAPLVGGLVISERAWNRLEPNAQAALRKHAAKAGEEMKSANRSQAKASVEAMKRRGLQVHELSPEMRVKWQRETEKVWPSIRGRLVPAELFDEVVKILEEHRAQGAKGGGQP